jgi:hypothetical protein
MSRKKWMDSYSYYCWRLFGSTTSNPLVIGVLVGVSLLTIYGLIMIIIMSMQPTSLLLIQQAHAQTSDQGSGSSPQFTTVLNRELGFMMDLPSGSAITFQSETYLNTKPLTIYRLGFSPSAILDVSVDNTNGRQLQDIVNDYLTFLKGHYSHVSNSSPFSSTTAQGYQGVRVVYSFDQPNGDTTTGDDTFIMSPSGLSKIGDKFYHLSFLQPVSELERDTFTQAVMHGVNSFRITTPNTPIDPFLLRSPASSSNPLVPGYCCSGLGCTKGDCPFNPNPYP